MKVDRLVSIIMILLEKKKVSAEELAQTFEVSKRTIYRDIESICMAGIPIRASSGVGGGFEIMPNYKVDKKVFTQEDLSTLLMGLSGLSGIAHGDEIIHTLSKVKSFIPPEQAKEIQIRSTQIAIDMDPWINNPEIKSNLELIKNAMKKGRILSFSYVGQHSRLQNRSAEPYQLVNKNGSWYLYAYCHLRKDFRLFKLSRMIDLCMTEESFELKDFPAPQTDGTDYIRSLQTEITLRIHASLAERVLDHCSFSRFSPDGDDHYIVRFPFIDRDYYYDLLMSFGPQCVCLGPPEIKEKLRQKTWLLSELYR